jgi:hypothetical protein
MIEIIIKVFDVKKIDTYQKLVLNDFDFNIPIFL